MFTPTSSLYSNPMFMLKTFTQPTMDNPEPFSFWVRQSYA